MSARGGSVLTHAPRSADENTTTLELKLNLQDQLAKDAQAAGLLNSAAISGLLKDTIRRRAALELLKVADHVAQAGIPSMRLEEIQAEVKAVRPARRQGAAGS